MALILTGSSGSTTLDSSAGLTFSDSSNQQYAASPYVLKNRIINGDMRIDQRNAGASITPTVNTYSVDRWYCLVSAASKYSAQQVSDAPTGFVNSLKITSLSSYTVAATDTFYVRQTIEGYNIADLGWGSATAKTITLSFWVKSSLTGTFGGSLTNISWNRSYPFSYTISSANTWEQKTVTITGDITGTWNTTNDVGVRVGFGLGVGSTYSGTAGAWAASEYESSTGATSLLATNGATWQITGVQLEVGSTATPFERRLYNQELANCQRYFYQLGGTHAYEMFGTGTNNTTTTAVIVVPMPVQMRTAPTLATSGSFVVKVGNTNTAVSGISLDTAGLQTMSVIATSTGLTVGNGNILFSGGSTAARFQLSAEL